MCDRCGRQMNPNSTVFLLLPGPQVCKIQHLDIQAASISICERMGYSLQLSEFKHGTMIRCYFSNKSVYKISSWQNIPHLAASGIIMKWKQTGMTGTQPQSEGPRKIT
ncbi:hypothetical protein CHARACLAT_005586 [Characodon lateralis]|uniref:Uncharacterized protein n=1 Tax=Characodon lateralis TaxID=208331 RepID=A0ABU7F122_9TELE|nr:hypothetical protein [Characodon lateralis]